ncbi:ion transporter [Aureispira anguillae]|uniref:Ion transporter n=1 Tax=Aureispira anguillae TaxID=2864201 RepID=A0A915YBL4_9BACT|nr:ion transporter [Aureispira anguillae]BDS10085.1 ion transporter [Aureispira anguillae]
MNPLKKIFLNDKIILLLISINAIIIFLQGFSAQTIGTKTHYVLMMIDDFISVCFLIEVFIKSRHFGLKEYLKPTWNKFDVLLILLSLPPLLARIFVDTTAANIGFLLVFRVFRVFKFFRFIQFFPQVEHIFRSIREALRASFMVLVGFFLFIFIMSILSCYMYQNIAPEYFKDPIVSYYSMFKVFTIEGWNTIPDEITANGELSTIQCFFTKFYFVTILVFGGVIGLSIVNSIFVDAMVSDNNDDLEEQVSLIKEDVTQLQEKVDRILVLLEESKRNSINKL